MPLDGLIPDSKHTTRRRVSIATRARERESLDRNEDERKDRNKGESKQGLVVSR